MASERFSIEVSFAWWLEWYLRAVVFFCVLHQQMPDQDKLQRVIRCAMRVRVR